MKKKDRESAYILWFNEIGIEDVPLVGGKNASLGEMFQQLTPKGVNIPNGFTITAAAYRHFLENAKIRAKIARILKGINVSDVNDLRRRGHEIRMLFHESPFPDDLREQIIAAYHKLARQYHSLVTDVAVRSSATAEDLPDASFAGQQETFLNIHGHAALLEAARNCFSSLFTNRAIAYRENKKFGHMSVSLSIAVQKMVRSDKAYSGVMFSIDTESGFKDAVLINAAYGLGENVVQGAVNPDEFYVFKPTLHKGFRPILSRKIGSKQIKMVYAEEGSKAVKNVPVQFADRNSLTLTDDEVLQLAKWACVIEDHYTRKAGKPRPMDMEWAKDGITGKLYIVQARPETVQSAKDVNVVERYKLKGKGKVLTHGSSVGSKIGSGTAHVIKDVKNIAQFKTGEVLVTDMTDPDWVPVMKKASAIVTNRGGRSCHAAIISRELGIPCVVGTQNATDVIKSGAKITVCCHEGEKGKICEGLIDFDVDKINLQHLPPTKTQVMVNIGAPEEAFTTSNLPVKGVGLAREEFIINSYIKIHPLALINYDKLEYGELKAQIDELTFNYRNKKDFFIDKLAEGVGTIVAAFYPNEVVVRLSDFKSNEYANLLGGTHYEPHEENPMLGWRGASRYYSKEYQEAFALECRGLAKVRDEMGLTNMVVMVPMVRTLQEGRNVVAAMKKHGLVQGKNGLKIYMMCEIPSNVVLAEEFAEIFDGFSIGSNDLTQLTLGVDRDSSLISHLFDERDPAVKWMVRHVIAVARKKNRKIGICGDAPSTFPDFAEFLVECGITSISLSPDAVVKTLMVVANKEKQMSHKKK